MSHTPNYDAKIKAILDTTKPGERVCELTGEKWDMTEEEISWYRKFNVPPSSHSPITRWKIISSFFIGNQIWYQQHPQTGQLLVTPVHPATGLRVLPDKEFYAQDFSTIVEELKTERPFFEQFRILQLKIPLPAGQNIEEPVRSIALVSLGDEDSYFVLASKTRRSFYVTASYEIEDSAEVYISNSVQSSYNIVHSQRIYKSFFIRESRDCLHSAFLFDCRDCEYCFGASNQRHKKYIWWNEQLSKEEWEKRRIQVDFTKRSCLEEEKKRFFLLVQKSVWPENFNEQAEESSGEYLTNCTRLSHCYGAHGGSIDQFWTLITISPSQGNAFCAGPASASDCYFSIPANCSWCNFCFECIHCLDCEYCIETRHCEHCFGCVGLRFKQFCILNKQYTEQDYWQKVDELKCVMLERGEYGNFFPASFSPSYYPQSGPNSYMGETTDEFGKKIGANLFDPDSCGAMGTAMDRKDVLSQKEIPDCLLDFDDEYSERVFFDKEFKRRFMYLKPELRWYRQQGIVPPNEHYILRLRNLAYEMNLALFDTTNCQNCKKKIMIAQNKLYLNRTIYCKSCYLSYLEERG